VATRDSELLEPEALEQPLSVGEVDVCHLAPQDAFQKSHRLHDGEGNETL